MMTTKYQHGYLFMRCGMERWKIFEGVVGRLALFCTLFDSGGRGLLLFWVWYNG
jgi:hypothetical protein